MNHLQLAFIIGLLGSLHCVGMCGPLAFAIRDNSQLKWIIALEKLTYNLGRTLSYAFLGLLVGLIGKQFWIAGLQQGVSIISGIFILMAALSRILPMMKINAPNFGINFLGPIQKLLIKATQRRGGHFFIGILNGFLPCGFVYLALAGAINTSSVLQSSLFMFFFGLGTIPLMLAATLGVSFASPFVRRRINNFLPFLMFFLGVWFIFRGLNLNIPYLSPMLTSTDVICH